ncbi:MAG TPA: hypothetical protein DD667_16880 [Gammaproteobacteria bacterium]|nr:hypothetical protein [Gammaproteobacteria bacterium]HCB40947.1 hypothetical protein [Gammaproteobacteria bacterium]
MQVTGQQQRIIDRAGGIRRSTVDSSRQGANKQNEATKADHQESTAMGQGQNAGASAIHSVRTAAL